MYKVAEEARKHGERLNRGYAPCTRWLKKEETGLRGVRAEIVSHHAWVVRIIRGYVGVVNKMVWRKF